MVKTKDKSKADLIKELASAKRAARNARRENSAFKDGAKWASEHYKESNR